MLGRWAVNQKSDVTNSKNIIEYEQNIDQLDECYSIAVLSLDRKNSKKAKERINEELLEQISQQSLKNMELQKQIIRDIIYKDAKYFQVDEILEAFCRPENIRIRFRKIMKLKLFQQPVQESQRNKFWLIVSNSIYNIYALHNSYYKIILDLNYYDFYLQTIELDLERTISKACTDTINKMRNVLCAYSRRNSQMGYCQGLNFICAFLLKKQLREEETFWIMCHVIENILPIDYYTNMFGTIVDQKVFADILKVHNPKISEKLDQLGLDLSVFTINWFICCFTNTFNLEICNIVWDHLLSHGSIAIIKAGIILLDLCEEKILKATEVIEIVEEKAIKYCDFVRFNKKMNDLYICKRLFEKSREIYRQQLEQEKQIQNRKSLGISQKQVNYIQSLYCDEIYPVCQQNLEKNKIEKEQTNQFIFRCEEFKIIDNYFDDKVQNGIRRHKSLQSISPPSNKNNPNDILIGRTEHICKPHQIEMKIKKKQLKLQSNEAGHENHININQLITIEESDSDEINQQPNNPREIENDIDNSIYPNIPLSKQITESNLFDRLRRTSSVKFLQSISRSNSVNMIGTFSKSNSRQILHAIDKNQI